MLRFYRYLIRSKLDYRCIVYGSTRKSYLQMLDPVHNQGLRFCFGAIKTFPIKSLYVDATKTSDFSAVNTVASAFGTRVLPFGYQLYSLAHFHLYTLAEYSESVMFPATVEIFMQFIPCLIGWNSYCEINHHSIPVRWKGLQLQIHGRFPQFLPSFNKPSYIRINIVRLWISSFLCLNELLD